MQYFWCFHYLLKWLSGQPGFAAFRQAPFLVPLHAQYTGMAPCDRLYQSVKAIESSQQHAELSLGFTAADIHDCGLSLVTYAETIEQAEALADQLFNDILDARDEFNTDLLSSAAAVELAQSNNRSYPVVIADVQDNPGAGGTADTTGLLHALYKAKAKQAVVGVICDAEVAKLAHQSGVGGVFKVALGSHSNIEGDLPFEGKFEVLNLSKDSITYQGEMYGGGVAEIGPSCLLSVVADACDIRIVVSSQRIQCLDQALFRHFGIALAVSK